MKSRCTAAHFNYHLLLRIHAPPSISINQELKHGCLLMPAGIVVVLHQLVESQKLVDGRHRELRGVNSSFLEGRENLTARQQAGCYAKLLHHLSAKPEKTHLHALQLACAFDGFLKPTRRLRRDDAADVDFDVIATIIVHFLI